jgi:lipoate---protein ligase
MLIHNETLPTAEENLALDEALVEVADRKSILFDQSNSDSESDSGQEEVLRLWELPSPCVVLGRASRMAEEVNSAACEGDGVPVLRRASGGATIVAGPDCLMYSVLVSYQKRPTWRGLDVAHHQVMSRIRDAVQNAADSFDLRLRIEIQGTCDLTITGRKFSGNALRCKRNWMIYHGTIMVAMPLQWLSKYLLEPPRQPAYREQRPHDTFVTNVLSPSSTVDAQTFMHALRCQMITTWNAAEAWNSCTWRNEVETETSRLLEERYTKSDWHRSR